MEMIKLAYQKSQQRSPKTILRLYNITFCHTLLCQSVLGKTPRKITKEKLYGTYYHSLTVHLPEVARIISPSSIHTENEEQLFSQIKQISLTTSSRKLDSIRDNSIIRIQAEQIFRSNQNPTGKNKSTCQSKISRFSQLTGMFDI